MRRSYFSLSMNDARIVGMYFSRCSGVSRSLNRYLSIFCFVTGSVVVGLFGSCVCVMFRSSYYFED